MKANFYNLPEINTHKIYLYFFIYHELKYGECQSKRYLKCSCNIQVLLSLNLGRVSIE